MGFCSRISECLRPRSRIRVSEKSEGEGGIDVLVYGDTI